MTERERARASKVGTREASKAVREPVTLGGRPPLSYGRLVCMHVSEHGKLKLEASVSHSLQVANPTKHRPALS